MGNWHSEIVDEFARIGEELGFSVVHREYRIMMGRIDQLWMVEDPVRMPLLAFEFESSAPSTQQIANIVKVLSLEPVEVPRFLIQVYRRKLPEDKLEYLQSVGRRLPVALLVIDDVGDDPR
ncbi:MAG: hypothetical protein ACE5IO_09295 [Thermoplasmata archaeon]